MASAGGYKPWRLTKSETLTSFEDWKTILINSLKQDKDFKPFLKASVVWSKRRVSISRGLTDDAGDTGKTKEDKAEDLEQLLGNIASFCTVINRKTIIEDSKCLDDVWQAIRLHYGIHTSGAHFLDVANFLTEPEERPADFNNLCLPSLMITS